MSHVVRSRWFGFVMGIVCALALVAALGSVAGVWAGPSAQDGQPPDQETNGPTSPDAAVARNIPVQGRLTNASGSPISGTRTITFTLYTASTGLGGVVCQDSDSVAADKNGLFSAVINGCTAADINGQDLWLGIWVQGEAAEMTPRQAIYPVPYAFSLVPGAEIGGISAGDGSLYLKDAAGVTMLALTASNGLLELGGIGNDGDIYVRNSTDTLTFQVDGATGDVKQDQAGDGLVKAGVLVNNCGTATTITRSFNNVAGTITPINGAAQGQCTIDFGFKVSDRYVVVSSRSSTPRIVTFLFNGTNRIDLYKFDSGGTAVAGDIMVLIY